METKDKGWKIVKGNTYNDDQDLLGFFDTEQKAKDEIPNLLRKYNEWIKSRDELFVKRVNPEMIPNPVCTDYMHYVWSLIPKEDRERVMKSDAAAEISCDNLMCGGETYYYLSRMIPKDWAVIDVGASYAAQSYLFQHHAKYVAVEPFHLDGDGWHFEHFKADGTERYEVTAGKFIKDILHTLNLDPRKTFAIANYLPNWYGENPAELVRQTFVNCYTYYPCT